MTVAQPGPFVVDDGTDVRSDCGTHTGAVGRRQRVAVMRDRGQRVRFLADVVLGAAEVLVLDHDHKCEQQAQK